jgi:hypothetical protein
MEKRGGSAEDIPVYEEAFAQGYLLHMGYD